MSSKKQVLTGIFWKFMERIGVQGSLFILQLILARILDPEHYGVLSMMVIFTSLANVFIQGGFNTALVQNKDVTEEDCSSVFWLTLSVAVVLYVLLFAAAPFIAVFYEMPDLTAPFRVLCLVLLPGSVNSIQLAIVSRNLDFKKIFRTNFASIVISGIIGIIMAKMGAGLWALVAQKLLNTSIACVSMWFAVKWRPRAVFNVQRIKVLFSFSWKLLVSDLMGTLFEDIRSLVIGKKFDSGTLGFYNRGKHFPQFLIKIIKTTLQSVMLPAMSAEQEDASKVKRLTRHSVSISAYVVFPMMAGLAGVGEPLVRLLLTEKWLPCVPYLQIYCITLAFDPVHVCNLQAINAVGRSDIYLKLEIIKKSLGLVLLALAVIFFDSPIVIAYTGLITALASCFINAYPNKRLIEYSYFEQIKDMFPSALASLVMLAAVLAVELLGLNDIVTLVLQVMTGVAVYVIISALARMEPFIMIKDLALSYIKK